MGISGATGGGLSTLDTTVSLADLTFQSNQAIGGPASFGSGSAISATRSTTLTGQSVHFFANHATGGNGVADYAGGSGQGGAVLLKGSQASFADSTFRSNLAGGAAGAGIGGDGQGGGIQALDGSLTITSSLFDGNQAIGGARAPALRRAMATEAACTAIRPLDSRSQGQRYAATRPWALPATAEESTSRTMDRGR